MTKMILAMDYKQWLLATTFFCTPDILREVAQSRALVRALKLRDKAKALAQAAAA